jgi:anthranilate phosphoribosyltransferase
MLALMRRIMSGEMSPVMIAALSIGLRVKKETIGEIAAAAQVMREFATPVAVADRRHLVDIVGTGGDGSHTFNISTAMSSWPQPPARAWPSTAGAACRPPPARPTCWRRSARASPWRRSRWPSCLAETGIAFMFAPNHHAR